MSRHRPPAPKPPPHITPEGYQRLIDEQKALWLRRKDVTAALSAAAAEGDRSENAEYIYRKKELREIDHRIHYLQKRLPELRVVDGQPDNPGQIFFGAWVTLETKDGDSHRYRLVGADEFDPRRGWISIQSPLAKQLLKKQIDDKVTVRTKNATTTYWIVDIDYQE